MLCICYSVLMQVVVEFTTDCTCVQLSAVPWMEPVTRFMTISHSVWWKHRHFKSVISISEVNCSIDHYFQAFCRETTEIVATSCHHRFLILKFMLCFLPPMFSAVILLLIDTNGCWSLISVSESLIDTLLIPRWNLHLLHWLSQNSDI